MNFLLDITTGVGYVHPHESGRIVFETSRNTADEKLLAPLANEKPSDFMKASTTQLRLLYHQVYAQLLTGTWSDAYPSLVLLWHHEPRLAIDCVARFALNATLLRPETVPCVVLWLSILTCADDDALAPVVDNPRHLLPTLWAAYQACGNPHKERVQTNKNQLPGFDAILQQLGIDPPDTQPKQRKHVGNGRDDIDDCVDSIDMPFTLSVWQVSTVPGFGVGRGAAQWIDYATFCSLLYETAARYTPEAANYAAVAEEWRWRSETPNGWNEVIHDYFDFDSVGCEDIDPYYLWLSPPVGAIDTNFGDYLQVEEFVPAAIMVDTDARGELLNAVPAITSEQLHVVNPRELVSAHQGGRVQNELKTKGATASEEEEEAMISPDPDIRLGWPTELCQLAPLREQLDAFLVGFVDRFIDALRIDNDTDQDAATEDANSNASGDDDDDTDEREPTEAMESTSLEAKREAQEQAFKLASGFRWH